MLEEVAAAAEVAADALPVGVDGCGVPTFGLTLERMAHAFSRLERLDGGAVAARAMRAHPELIRGPGAADTELMLALPGWAAKGGAEALLCAVSPDGLGIAVKVEDGAGRAVRSATAAFLGRLGLDTGVLGEVPTRELAERGRRRDPRVLTARPRIICQALPETARSD